MNVGTLHHQKKCGPHQSCQMRRKRGKREEEFGSRSRRAKRSWSLSSTARTCALKVYKCVVLTTQESQVTGKLFGRIPKRRQAQCSGKFSSEEMLERDSSRGRRPIEHCAGHSAQKHGLRLENYRAEWWSREVLPSRTCALVVIAFRLRTTFGGSLLGIGRNCAAGGVRHVAASMIGGL